MRIYIYFLLLFIFHFTQKTNAQFTEFVFNSDLTFQVMKNGVVRESSSQLFIHEYQKENELYEQMNKDMAQIVIIHNHIFNQLTNVNAYFRQGKKLKHFLYEIQQTIKAVNKTKQLLRKYPKYWILLKTPVNDVYTSVIGISSEVKNVLNKDHEKLLIDHHDRDDILERFLMRIINIKISIYALNARIEWLSYHNDIMNVPILGDYINKDKALIENIITKYKLFKIM